MINMHILYNPAYVKADISLDWEINSWNSVWKPFKSKKESNHPN